MGPSQRIDILFYKINKCLYGMGGHRRSEERSNSFNVKSTLVKGLPTGTACDALSIENHILYIRRRKNWARSSSKSNQSVLADGQNGRTLASSDNSWEESGIDKIFTRWVFLLATTGWETWALFFFYAWSFRFRRLHLPPLRIWRCHTVKPCRLCLKKSHQYCLL